MDKDLFMSVKELFSEIEAIKGDIATGFKNGYWWIKFQLDINHKLAWNVVQEFGNILNYLFIEERLPTRFYPVSPPIYLNGGPKEYLSWVIENTDKKFTIEQLIEWLRGRLPNPIENEDEWLMEEE